MMELDLKLVLTEAVEDVNVESLESSVDEILKAIRFVASVISILELYTVTPLGILLGPDATTANR